MSSMKATRILIVEVNWLGDVLFSTPAIKALRKKFPESFISCLIIPRVKEVLEGNPDINELIIYDEEGRHKFLPGKLKLISRLRKEKFDLAILFHRSFTRALLTYLAGIPRRAGYSTAKRRFLLTEPLPMPEKDSLHRVDHYLHIASHLGCDGQDRFYEFFPNEDDERFALDFILAQGVSAGDFVICLNPGGNWLPKRWPKEYFAVLADKLINEHKAKVIFTGSKNDTGLIVEIAAQMSSKPIIAAGKTNLKQLAGIFKRADLVISGDSGPLHIAASVGANVIGLFGPTSTWVTGPLGEGKIVIIRGEIDCKIPCYDKDCEDNRCMKAITPEEVVEKIKSFSL